MLTLVLRMLLLVVLRAPPELDQAEVGDLQAPAARHHAVRGRQVAVHVQLRLVHEHHALSRQWVSHGVDSVYAIFIYGEMEKKYLQSSVVNDHTS